MPHLHVNHRGPGFFFGNPRDETRHAGQWNPDPGGAIGDLISDLVGGFSIKNRSSKARAAAPPLDPLASQYARKNEVEVRARNRSIS
jgi:hypothetical protein